MCRLLLAIALVKGIKNTKHTKILNCPGLDEKN
jgi:hypothetical protein